MAEGTFYQRLRPTGAGFMNEGWLTSAYTNIDDNVSAPTISGTGDYIESTYNNGDDEEWQGYTLTDPTVAYWWNRIAKLEVNFLYFASTGGDFKTRPKFNVSWVHSGIREGWSPSSLSLFQGKTTSALVYGAWTWSTVSFYPNEPSKPNAATDWTYLEWVRANVAGIEVEARAPDFKDPGEYWRIAVLYVDLYVWPTFHSGA